jgi:hypothetical protein
VYPAHAPTGIVLGRMVRWVMWRKGRRIEWLGGW